MDSLLARKRKQQRRSEIVNAIDACSNCHTTPPAVGDVLPPSWRRRCEVTLDTPNFSAEDGLHSKIGGRTATASHVQPDARITQTRFIGTLRASTIHALPALVRDTTMISSTPLSLDALPLSTSGVTVVGTRLPPFSCIVLDLETTGFCSEFNAIVEVGCRELRWCYPASATTTSSSSDRIHAETSRKRLRTPLSPNPVALQFENQGGHWELGSRFFHSYVRFTDTMDSRAASIHGISPEELHAAPPWEQVATDLASFFTLAGGTVRRVRNAGMTSVQEGDGGEGAGLAVSQETCEKAQKELHLPPIVAHNAVFDAAFLDTHLTRAGYKVIWHSTYPLTCTMRWMRQMYPSQPADLDRACYFFCPGSEESRVGVHHSAIEDATLCAKLFLHLSLAVEETTLDFFSSNPCSQ